MAHRARKLSVHGLQQEVVVVGHQRVSAHANTEATGKPGHRLEEELAGAVVGEDALPSGAAVHAVVPAMTSRALAGGRDVRAQVLDLAQTPAPAHHPGEKGDDQRLYPLVPPAAPVTMISDHAASRACAR